MKTEQFDYEIRQAGYDDIDAIVDTALAFWKESEYSKGEAPADPGRFKQFIREGLDRDGTRCIIAVSEGKVLGYVMFYLDFPDYKDGIDGELYQFFTHPQARGTGISRDLIEMMEQTYDDWGCGCRYAILSAEIGEKELSQVKNLFAKFGYEVTGIIMTKRR